MRRYSQAHKVIFKPDHNMRNSTSLPNASLARCKKSINGLVSSSIIPVARSIAEPPAPLAGESIELERHTRKIADIETTGPPHPFLLLRIWSYPTNGHAFRIC